MYICCLCIIGVENILHLENNLTESLTQYLGQEHVNCWKRSLNAKQISWSSYYTATIILWQQDLPRSQSHFWVKIQLTSKKPQSSTFPFPKLDHQKLPPSRGKNALCAHPQISTILNHVIQCCQLLISIWELQVTNNRLVNWSKFRQIKND